MKPKTQVQIMRDAGWLVPTEAAQLAGVHAATIYRLLDEGSLEEQRVGRMRYVSRASLADHYNAPPLRARILEEPLVEEAPELPSEEETPCASS